MKEQTIYSYKLLARFRWSWPGLLLQFSVLLASLILFALPVANLSQVLASLSVLVLLPVSHYLLFRFSAYTAGEQAKSSPDKLFSAWWGADTRYPVPLPFFRRTELTVTLGSLLIAALLFAWFPAVYGITLLTGAVACCIPRLIALVVTYRQPRHCRVRYEQNSIAFLETDG